MNIVTLTGRITKAPEGRQTNDGQSVCSFTVACDRVYRDRQGNVQREADFINCVAFGNQASFILRYVQKGNMLAIQGRIQTRNYQDQQGQTRYVTEVLVNSVENLTPRSQNDNQQNYQQQNYQQPNRQQNQNPYQGYNNPTYGMDNSSKQEPQSFSVSSDDDDLPF
jgi:single-strand DNA-binding protein